MILYTENSIRFGPSAGPLSTWTLVIYLGPLGQLIGGLALVAAELLGRNFGILQGAPRHYGTWFRFYITTISEYHIPQICSIMILILI